MMVIREIVTWGVTLMTGNSSKGTVSFDTGDSLSTISPKPKLTDNGEKPAWHILLYSISTTYWAGSLDDGCITSIILETLK
jgi:hypothetical protein